MRRGGLGVVGPLLLLAGAVAGCTGAADAGSEVRPGHVAVPSYTAAAGTPGYCAALADSTHLTGIPAAIGVLAGEPGDVQAELDLSSAIEELRTVLEQIGDEGGSPRLEAEIGELVDALDAARDGSVTASMRDDLSAALHDVGRVAQPVCRFPT